MCLPTSESVIVLYRPISIPLRLGSYYLKIWFSKAEDVFCSAYIEVKLHCVVIKLLATNSKTWHKDTVKKSLAVTHTHLYTMMGCDAMRIQNKSDTQ